MCEFLQFFCGFGYITKGHNGKPRYMALKDSTQERFQRYLTHSIDEMNRAIKDLQESGQLKYLPRQT